jgi:hypothetical protein
MGLIKIFSGNETLAMNLHSKIEAVEIKTVLKPNTQASRIGNQGQVLEVFINEIDYGKVSPVLEEFRMSI